MTRQATEVLQLLQRDGARSGDSIATELNVPTASVRRAVTELSNAGVRIIRPDRGNAHGEYRLLS